jgi:hypothetical protein
VDWRGDGLADPPGERDADGLADPPGERDADGPADHFGEGDAEARRSLVVVPEVGLARLTRHLLDGLGVPGVPVAVYDDWVLARARALVPDLPPRIWRDAPAAVIRFKRHPALWRSLPGYVEELGTRLAERLDRQLAARGRIAASYGEHRNAAGARGGPPPLRAVFESLEKEHARTVGGRVSEESRRAFEQTRHRLGQIRQDLAPLLGDAHRLEGVVADSGGALTFEMALAVLRHLRDQLQDTDEERFAHVDPERRTAVDGLATDVGTPAEQAGTVDLEDCALLLRLRHLTLGPPPAAHRRVEHLVVDEAQELTGPELATLANALAPGATVTVAGDPGQQIDPAVGFEGWEAALSALGVADAEHVTLQTSYRCPAPVWALAQRLRDPEASGDVKADVKTDVGEDLANTSGTDATGATDARADAKADADATSATDAKADAAAPVLVSAVDGDGHRAATLVEALRRLLRRDPEARVAVVAHTEPAARRCWDGLRLADDLDARLVLDGRFPFTPGIDVTTVAEVKGLEFDYVAVPDATAAEYPDRARQRRELYVALTRTVGQLWLLHDGLFTPLLAAPGPATSGPATSGPATSGPATCGPATCGPAFSGPASFGPATSGPATSGPATSGPATSGPATSGPTTSGPTTSGPAPTDQGAAPTDQKAGTYS